MVAAIALIVVLTCLFYKVAAKKFHLKRTWKTHSFAQKHAIAMRLLIVALAGGTFFFCTDFIRHHNGERYQYISILGTNLTAWNQNRNYDDNGFIVGFLYNFQKTIRSKYNAEADEANLNRKDPAKDDVNVVVILNESFYDPSVEFNGVKFEDYLPHSGGEIMPNLHKIQQNYPSGLMYSLDYGGGTANIEFETLTSMTNYWVNTVPYTALVPKAGEIPSLAQMLKTKVMVTSLNIYLSKIRNRISVLLTR